MSSYLPHLRKIRKAKRSKPSTVENDVAKAIYDLELNHRTLRTQLPRFHFNTAKELDTTSRASAAARTARARSTAPKRPT